MISVYASFCKWYLLECLMQICNFVRELHWLFWQHTHVWDIIVIFNLTPVTQLSCNINHQNKHSKPVNTIGHWITDYNFTQSYSRQERSEKEYTYTEQYMPRVGLHHRCCRVDDRDAGLVAAAGTARIWYNSQQRTASHCQPSITPVHSSAHMFYKVKWVGFNVPLNTLQVISGTVLRVKWPNQQCQSTEGSGVPEDRLQSHQVHLTMLQT